MVQAANDNGFAIASLVLGIVWLCWIGSFLAISFGRLAISQIRDRGQQGNGLAIAGLTLGLVEAGTFILLIFLPHII